MEKMSQLLQEKSVTRGLLIGIMGGTLLLILGGLFLWGTIVFKEPPATFVPPPNNEPETPRADADIQILKTVSSSDELSSIRTDLDSTNMDALDKELELIEADFSR